MSDLINRATDVRQTPQWANYLEKIGWLTKKIGNTQIYIHPNKLFKNSLVKIPHADNPIPIQEIEKEIKEHNPLFILIEPHIRGYNKEIYIQNGYQISHLRASLTSTILVDISKDENELLKSFSENARRNIKKAQKNNLTIKNIPLNTSEGQKNFEEFYNLYHKLGKIKKFYTLPKKECDHKKNAFINNSFLSIASDEKNTTIGAVWYAICDQTLTYLHTGITPKGYELLANYLLVFEGIKYAKKKGCTVLDFESIYDERYKNENKKWIGFSEFKKKFRGEIIHYPPAWIKIYNIPYKLLYVCSSIFS